MWQVMGVFTCLSLHRMWCIQVVFRFSLDLFKDGLWSDLTNESGDNSMAECVGHGMGNSVSDQGGTAVSSVESVRGVLNGGHVGTESLGLGGGPVLSLEGLAHRLVGHLSGTTSHMSNISDMAS